MRDCDVICRHRFSDVIVRSLWFDRGARHGQWRTVHVRRVPDVSEATRYPPLSNIIVCAAGEWLRGAIQPCPQGRYQSQHGRRAFVYDVSASDFGDLSCDAAQHDQRHTCVVDASVSCPYAVIDAVASVSSIRAITVAFSSVSGNVTSAVASVSPGSSQGGQSQADCYGCGSRPSSSCQADVDRSRLPG